MTIVETGLGGIYGCGWRAWLAGGGCGYIVSGINGWLECIGVVSGCCCKVVYYIDMRYHHNNYYFSLLHLY